MRGDTSRDQICRGTENPDVADGSVRPHENLWRLLTLGVNGVSNR